VILPVPQDPVSVSANHPVRPAPPGGWAYATFSTRALAFTIDQMLLFVIMTGVMFPASILFGLGQMAAWPFATIMLVPSTQALWLVVSWIYFAMQEASHYRATFGKRICGLYVCDMQGNRITLTRATVRFFSKFVSYAIMLIGFIMAAFTERHQALHDIMAETLVLKKVSS